MLKIPYTDEDIKNAKINLANQKLTSFQSAILFQHIENLHQRIDKAIELCDIVIKNEPLQATLNEELLDQVCGIKKVLQGKEIEKQ